MYKYEALWFIKKWRKGLVSTIIIYKNPFLIPQLGTNIHLIINKALEIYVHLIEDNILVSLTSISE